jgi:hypothetical protein
MSETAGKYQGKPLEEYSKEELIGIILEMGRSQQADHARHRRDLDALVPPRRFNPCVFGSSAQNPPGR